jgi:hypothetical protein
MHEANNSVKMMVDKMLGCILDSMFVDGKRCLREFVKTAGDVAA